MHRHLHDAADHLLIYVMSPRMIELYLASLYSHTSCKRTQNWHRSRRQRQQKKKSISRAPAASNSLHSRWLIATSRRHHNSNCKYKPRRNISLRKTPLDLEMDCGSLLLASCLISFCPTMPTNYEVRGRRSITAKYRRFSSIFKAGLWMYLYICFPNWAWKLGWRWVPGSGS